MTSPLRSLVPGLAAAALAATLPTASVGCRDTSRFSSRDGCFEGPVVSGSFVRSGIAEDVLMCLALDTDRLQDAPGTLTTSDGRFDRTPLRPIPQIWHDPLSTLHFGDGRIKNLVYAASPRATGADAQDILVVVSLMQSDGIEVRLLRGAPLSDAGAPPPGVASAVFGIFTLERRPGACSF